MCKKIICLIAVLCMALGFAACSGNTLANGDNGVDMNGGFVAETKDYVYFINGVESYSTSYKTGKVTKGALMRVAKNKFATAEEADYETVVSKLIVSADKNAGFYINGDYVYYAVPSTENDRKGEVKNDQLLFFRTKLDASATSSKISDKDFANDAEFRFIASGDKVYLAVYSTDLYVYDAINGGEVFNTEDTTYADKGTNAKRGDIQELLFDEDNASACIYYTFNPINVAHWQDDVNATAENYYDIWKVTLGATVTEEVVESGVGLVGSENATEGELIGLTFDLLRHKNGKLYYSQTSLNTNVGATVYKTLNDADKQIAELTYATEKTTAAFADTSLLYFVGDKAITLYVDSTLGLVKFDYEKAGSTAADSDFGVNVVSDKEALKTATLKFISTEGEKDYLYYVDSNSNYYKINLTALLNGEDVEALRINTLALNVDWYLPEVVTIGDKCYFVCVYSDATYKSYVYAVDVTAIGEGVEAVKAEKGDDYTESDYYTYDSDNEEDAVKLGFRLGLLAEADKDETK